MEVRWEVERRDVGPNVTFGWAGSIKFCKFHYDGTQPRGSENKMAFWHFLPGLVSTNKKYSFKSSEQAVAAGERILEDWLEKLNK